MRDTDPSVSAPLAAWPVIAAPEVERARSRALRLGLDHGQAMDVALGATRGISWARLRGLAPVLAAAREEVRLAHEAAATPLLAQLGPERAAAARALAASWATRFDRVVVFGEAAGVDALMLALPAEPSPGICACPGPALAPLRRAIAGAAQPLVVLVGQAAWVRAQAIAAGAGELHVLPSEEDGVFTVLSVEALALATLAGTPPDDLLAACAAVVGRSADPQHDVARRLAGLTQLLADSCGLSRIDLVAASPGAVRLSRVVAAGWAAVCCKAPVGTVRTPGADAPRCRRLGDEAELQRVHEGPGDQWTLCFRELAVQGEPDAVTEQLVAAEAALWLERGAPYVQLRVVVDDPGSRVAAALVCIEAALTVAVLKKVSPLEMPTADRFRERVASGVAPGLDGAPAPQE